MLKCALLSSFFYFLMNNFVKTQNLTGSSCFVKKEAGCLTGMKEWVLPIVHTQDTSTSFWCNLLNESPQTWNAPVCKARHNTATWQCWKTVAYMQTFAPYYLSNLGGSNADIRDKSKNKQNKNYTHLTWCVTPLHHTKVDPLPNWHLTTLWLTDEL